MPLLPHAINKTLHVLRIAPANFVRLAIGTKTCEIRRNDRDFKIGDSLCLAEWTKETGYSGRCAYTVISDIDNLTKIVEMDNVTMTDGVLYVVLSLRGISSSIYGEDTIKELEAMNPT